MSDVLGMAVHPAAELFPMLADDELRELAEDIRAHGLHEPLWVWSDPDRGPVLLDGRNRLAACKLAGVRPTTRTYVGDDPVTFVISENVRRRHLTPGQLASVGSRAKPLYAAQIKAREARRKTTPPHRQGSKRTTADRRESSSVPVDSGRAPTASQRAAQSTGAPSRNIDRYERVKKAEPDLAAQVDAGMPLDRAERIVRDRIAERARIEQARREAEAQPEPTRVDIRHGDFREVLADLSDVDAIITDPPYPREYLPLLADLAVWADKVLTPDGVLAVLMGQTHLPEVYRLLDGGRPYRWTACYLTPGLSYMSHARRLHSNWKPLLIYGGGPRFADVIRAGDGDADAKNNHKWGQDYQGFHTIVNRLTTRRQTVVDPFMGSGTTLLAAHALGRHAIGADTELEHVNTARKRISG